MNDNDNHKPSKPLPGAMKAAKEIDRILENNSFKSRDYTDQELSDNGWPDTFMGWNRPTFIKCLAGKIDYETNISAKESALRQLIKAAGNRLDVWTKETYFDLVAALDNAKKSFEDEQ